MYTKYIHWLILDCLLCLNHSIDVIWIISINYRPTSVRRLLGLIYNIKLNENFLYLRAAQKYILSTLYTEYIFDFHYTHIQSLYYVQHHINFLLVDFPCSSFFWYMREATPTHNNRTK